MLTGKYSPGEPPPEDSRAASDEMGWAMDRYLADEVLEAVQRLVPIAEDAGLTMASLALAWCLREENVASAIIGASRPEQVHQNAEASGVELDQNTLDAIDDALADVAVTGPQAGELRQGRRQAPLAGTRARQGGSGISTDASRLPRGVGSAHSTAGCRGAHSGARRPPIRGEIRMPDSLRRLAPLTGIVFAVLLAVTFSTPSTPDVHDTGSR